MRTLRSVSQGHPYAKGEPEGGAEEKGVKGGEGEVVGATG